MANFAFDPDAPAVQFHQVFRDRQAQARAAGLARARRVHAIKPLEDALLIGVGNPDAGIADRDCDARGVSRRAGASVAGVAAWATVTGAGLGALLATQASNCGCVTTCTSIGMNAWSMPHSCEH